MALAAVVGKKGDQLAHCGVIRRVEDEAALLPPMDQPDPAELGQMKGQGRRRKAEHLADGPGLETFRPGLDKRPKNGKARLVTERSKGF